MNKTDTLAELDEHIEQANGLMSTFNSAEGAKQIAKSMHAIAHCVIGLTILARHSFAEHEK